MIASSVGDVGDGIDIVQLASSYDGCEQRPIFGANLMTGKECVFLVKQTGRIAFSTGLVSSSRRPSSRKPVSRVVDVIGELRAAGDHRQLFLEPRLQRGDDGQRMLLRDQLDVRRLTAHRGFDGVKVVRCAGRRPWRSAICCCGPILTNR